MSTLPLADYALLSDYRSAALVSRAGSVDWLCFPRFDGPAVFARLLDDAAGHFQVGVPGATVTRRYLDQTMALETTFHGTGGTAALVDALAVGRNERGHELGAGSPGLLRRLLTCTDGEVEAAVAYAPRPEYGLVHPLLEPVDGGLAARGGADRLLLSAPGDRGRGDHLAAGDGRRRAQLGLPLQLGAGRQPHHGGPVGDRLPRRGPQVLRLPGRRGRLAASPGTDLQVMFGVGGAPGHIEATA
jgi:hypothetical protein